MKGIMKNLLFFCLACFAVRSFAMQEWFRTNLESLGLSQPKLTPTQELRQIIEREGTFKNTDLSKLQELVAMQADVNTTTSDGKTPLLIAIQDNDEAKVRLFAQFAKADINKKYGPDQLTPLAIAAYEGHARLIPILLRYRAIMSIRDAQGNTPLMLAMRLADEQKAIQVARVLLNAGIDINAQNSSNDTALHRAVQKKKYELITFLIQNGADVNLVNNQNQTPLMLAQVAQDQKAQELLVPRPRKIE